ncbi:NIPSNAP family protein [Sediminicola sp. 1XM1-17]|uniref:NIPSNAP family protein n=1 Tax=Sediminicola sp. 1XM1-17 TaxID=3127702 RepID=UPI0030771590
MKSITLRQTLWANIILFLFVIQLRGQEEQRELIQLKTYTFINEAQEKITHDYLSKAYIPALKNLNIDRIGVFKKRSMENDTLNQLLVLIPFKDFDQFESLESTLILDKNYLLGGKEYLQASHDQAPYLRVSSTLLKAFKDMPVLKPTPLDGPRAERIYELRSYESPTEERYRNKVKMFNEGGEVILFEELGFNAVFYGEVLSGCQMPNLMYMTTFSNQESRDAHWKTFIDSPKWKSLSAMPEYQNNVSHIDIDFLYPTDYSDY